MFPARSLASNTTGFAPTARERVMVNHPVSLTATGRPFATSVALGSVRPTIRIVRFWVFAVPAGLTISMAGGVRSTVKLRTVMLRLPAASHAMATMEAFPSGKRSGTAKGSVPATRVMFAMRRRAPGSATPRTVMFSEFHRLRFAGVVSSR